MRCPHTLVISSVQSGERRSALQVRGEGVSREPQLDSSTIEHDLVAPATHLLGVFSRHALLIGSSDLWQAPAWRSFVPVARCCPFCLSIFPVVNRVLCVVHVGARFQKPETVASAQYPKKNHHTLSELGSSSASCASVSWAMQRPVFPSRGLRNRFLNRSFTCWSVT